MVNMNFLRKHYVHTIVSLTPKTMTFLTIKLPREFDKYLTKKTFFDIFLYNFYGTRIDHYVRIKILIHFVKVCRMFEVLHKLTKK